MKYLCIICAETMMEMMPEAGAATHYDEYAALTQDIKKSDHFLGANRLKPVDSATTVRLRNGKLSMTDGSFPKPRNSLAVTTSSMPNIPMMSSRSQHELIPGAGYGCVELRHITEDTQTLAIEPDSPRG